MENSEITLRWGWFEIDMGKARDWSVDSVAKRTIAVAALALIMIGSYPLVTSVHGQQPKTRLDYEIEELRSKVGKLDTMPTEIALIIAHQKVEDERYKEQQDFQGRMIWGFLGTGGGVLMAIFGWAISQFGITFTKLEQQSKRRMA